MTSQNKRETFVDSRHPPCTTLNVLRQQASIQISLKNQCAPRLGHDFRRVKGAAADGKRWIYVRHTHKLTRKNKLIERRAVVGLRHIFFFSLSNHEKQDTHSIRYTQAGRAHRRRERMLEDISYNRDLFWMRRHRFTHRALVCARCT